MSLITHKRFISCNENIKHYKRLIDKAKKCVNDLMAEFNSVITTVTGIENRLGAVILAEIRNIHAFDNPAQLQAFAGLDSSIYQSGQIDLAKTLQCSHHPPCKKTYPNPVLYPKKELPFDEQKVM
ncbi:transposase [Streptococcus pneumoniae]|nr:transposase [Streptococcus pneumoniae]